MSDAWESYFCNVNDELASVFVDVGIATKVPDRKRPHLLWIWVEMQKPRPDGLSSREEAEVLWKLEDSLTAALAKGYKAVLAGRITTQGRREFYFYAAKKPKDDSMLASALTKFQRYQYEWGTKEDPSWDQYFSVLYPSAEDFEKIKNRHVLESPEKHGDILSNHAKSGTGFISRPLGIGSISRLTFENSVSPSIPLPKTRKKNIRSAYASAALIKWMPTVSMTWFLASSTVQRTLADSTRRLGDRSDRLKELVN